MTFSHLKKGKKYISQMFRNVDNDVLQRDSSIAILSVGLFTNTRVWEREKKSKEREGERKKEWDNSLIFIRRTSVFFDKNVNTVCHW